MNIIEDCRYIYRVGDNHPWCESGHYGSLTAISMEDARRHLPPHTLIVRAKLGPEMAQFVDWAGQNVRCLVFFGARTVEDLDSLSATWREEEKYNFNFEEIIDRSTK